jgi:hypothetical protein
MEDDHYSSSIVTIALLLYWLAGAFDTETESRNRKRRERYTSLSVQAKRRRVRKIPRVVTVSPTDSPWQKLYRSKSLEGFITATGLDPLCFEQLLALFVPIFLASSPYSQDGAIREVNENETRGRPRLINAAACLGLVLYWSWTSCHLWTGQSPLTLA